jgi:hypothetical protein
MFNLDQAILEWRRQMLAAEIKSPVPLDELEAHLRDEIEEQAKSGLSEAEAFKTAVQKIGQGHIVQTEFKKLEAKWEDLEWKLAQILILGGLSLFSLVMARDVLLKTGNSAGLTFGQQMSCLAAVSTMLSLMWGGRLSYRRFPVIRAKHIRSAISLCAFVVVALWWVVLFYIILPRHDFDKNQLIVIFCWGFVAPIGGSTGFCLGIETAARKRVAMAGS